jgi:hypothetical protein
MLHEWRAEHLLCLLLVLAADYKPALLLLLLLLLQVLTFVSSLFGDLIESIMKRDAGIKVRLADDAASSLATDTFTCATYVLVCSPSVFN